MPKIIIGLVGEIAAGKDTVANYLKDRYQAEVASFSAPIRDTLNLLYQPVSRVNLSDLGRNLRQQFGEDILSYVIAKKVAESGAELVVLPNIRLESDIAYLKDLPGFVLVAVDADERIRYERLIKRDGQYVDDKTKTWEEFKKDAELYTERNIRDLMAKCQYRLTNNGTDQGLFEQIESLLNTLRK